MKNVFVSQETLTALASVPFLNERQAATLTERAAFLRSFDRIDDNPTYIGGGLYACGPTTGLWVGANGMEVIGWWQVGGVRFDLAALI